MNWTKSKVLVTGGASFIGSHLVEKLLSLGCASVRVADDLSSGSLANLSSVRKDVEFLQGDLRRMDFAESATKGCQVVFHLAADHGGRGYISSHPANCAGNMALDNIVIDAASRNGVEQVTYASSACVYPTDIQDEPMLLKESMVSFEQRGGAFADEEYGWAKLMGELSLRAHHRQHGIKAASARISTAYGPRENESHAVIALIAKAHIRQSPFEIWGDGEQSRGFTFVDDVVSGLIAACEHVDNGEAVNVGSAEFYSINQLVELIFDAVGWRPRDGIRYLPNGPVGVKHRALDGEKSLRLMGWKPTVSIEDGIRRTVDWYTSSIDPGELAFLLGPRLIARGVA